MNLLGTKRPIILGSSSPRRQDMLKQLGLNFEICSPQIHEEARVGESPSDYVRRNCTEKAEWVFQQHRNRSSALIITADTIVVHQDTILEKPRDQAEARRMLQTLSGAKHQVMSGFCLVELEDGAKLSQVVCQEVTDVYFAELTAQDIDFYVSTGEPLDKAGSYGIQAIGGFLVDRIHGSYSNVVGLPLQQLIQAVRNLAP